jgi:hypothetical protein
MVKLYDLILKIVNHSMLKPITMKSIFFFLIAVFMIQGVSAQQVARPRSGPTGSWRYLGTTSARSTADHDVIIVAGPYDFFRKLKFKVKDSGLEMYYILVRYDDGGAPERIETRFNIPQGGESRVIDIRGGKRKLKSVEFYYRDKGILNGKADVMLYGIK